MALAQIDPNLFRLDWDRLAEVLAIIVVLAFFLERALALVFESKAYRKSMGDKGARPWIALLFAFAICRCWDLDAIGIVLVADETSVFGEMITAGVIAGGSKGAMKLFQDVMGVKPTTLEPGAGGSPEAGLPDDAEPSGGHGSPGTNP